MNDYIHWFLILFPLILGGPYGAWCRRKNLSLEFALATMTLLLAVTCILSATVFKL